MSLSDSGLGSYCHRSSLPDLSLAAKQGIVVIGAMRRLETNVKVLDPVTMNVPAQKFKCSFSCTLRLLSFGLSRLPVSQAQEL